MRAVWYETFGPAEVLQYGELEKPQPKDGEVLVRMFTSGINPSDVKKRGGSNPDGLKQGHIVPHSDGAGRMDRAGDLDADGLDDVLVGAPAADLTGEWAGAAFVYLGPITGTQTYDDAQASYLGESEGDTAGYSVSSAGDVDADGVPDLFIGAPYNSDLSETAGAAYLIYGSAL